MNRLARHKSSCAATNLVRAGFEVNRHRLLDPLGYMPPAEYEEACYRQQETQLSLPALR